MTEIFLDLSLDTDKCDPELIRERIKEIEGYVASLQPGESFFENEEYHKEHILNWLKGYINGMKPAPKKSEIEQSMRKANLSLEKRIKVGLFAGELRRKDGEI